MPTRRQSVALVTVVIAAAVAVGSFAPAVSGSPVAADAVRGTHSASDIAGFPPPSPPPERWSRTYGSDAGDLTAVTTDDGGFVAVGSVLTADGSSNRGWVVAVAPDGDRRFSETYGTGGEGRLRAVVTTPDGGYVIAGTLTDGDTVGDDGWVLKIDATGSVVWERTFGGGGDDTFAAIQSVDDGYLLAGTSGTGRETDGLLVKIDASGHRRWDATYDGGPGDRIRDIAPHPAGGYLLAGEATRFVGAPPDGWTVHVEADGTELHQRRVGGAAADRFRAVARLGGDLLLAGESRSYGTGERRGWVLRRGPNATERWNRTYDLDGVDALATTTDGFLLAGIETTDTGTLDGVLVGGATDGSAVWRRSYGRANDDLFSDVLVGPDGGYLLAGTSYSGDSEGTGWLLALGQLVRTTTATTTATPLPATTTSSTATVVSGTTAGPPGRGQRTAGGTTTRTASGAVTSATAAVGPGGDVAGGTTTTNATAAGGGSFPWPVVALLLIVIVLGGVFVAVRRQAVADSASIAEGDGSTPRQDDQSIDASSDADREESDATDRSPHLGPPRDPDPLGTNARSPGEAAKLFAASVSLWLRRRVPFLADPRPPGTASASDAAESGSGVQKSGESETDTSGSATGSTGGSTVADAEQSPAGKPARGADTAADANTEPGTGHQETGAGGSEVGTVTGGGSGEPGTFTLRNPGEETTVVAFRCQTADETLFNYYAEMPPGTIKRAKKLPAEGPFEITIAITDGPSEVELFENDGPDGQDVTVTVAPDTIRMETGPDDRQTDAAIRGTVEPETSDDAATGDTGTETADESTSPTDEQPSGSTTADDQETSVDDQEASVDDQEASTTSRSEPKGPEGEGSDEPESVVSGDVDDVLPGIDDEVVDGGDTVESESAAAERDGAAEVDDTTVTDDADETVDESVPTESESDDGGEAGSFEALKEEFESGDADWADDEE